MIKIIVLILSLLATSVAFAGSEPFSRKGYVYNEKNTYTFGYKTDTSRTFVYQTKLEGEVVRRLEFNISSFPFHQTLEVPTVWGKQEAALNKIKEDYPNASIADEHFNLPTQSFELSVSEVLPGLYAANFEFKKADQFSATKIESTNQVIALADSGLHSNSGSALRLGERELSARATPRGWQETTWFFTE